MAVNLDRFESEHRQLEDILAEFDREVEGFLLSDDLDHRTWRELVDATELDRDRGHRSRERQLFERLTHRSGRPLLVLEILKRRTIAASTAQQRLSTVLDGAVVGKITARTDLESAAQSYIGALRGQIALEERAVFPVLRRTLDARDLRRLQ